MPKLDCHFEGCLTFEVRRIGVCAVRQEPFDQLDVPWPYRSMQSRTSSIAATVGDEHVGYLRFAAGGLCGKDEIQHAVGPGANRVVAQECRNIIRLAERGWLRKSLEARRDSNTRYLDAAHVTGGLQGVLVDLCHLAVRRPGSFSSISFIWAGGAGGHYDDCSIVSGGRCLQSWLLMVTLILIGRGKGATAKVVLAGT